MRRKEYYIKISIFGEIYSRYLSIKKSVVFLYLRRGYVIEEESIFRTRWITILYFFQQVDRR